MIRIAMVQASPGTNPMETLAQFSWEAKQENCHVVCFPEAFLTGYHPQEVAQKALRQTELEPVSQLAQELQLDILTGFMEQQDTTFYLTHGIFRPDGSREFYRKTHLGTREEGIFTPGQELSVYSLSSGTKIGFQTCVECHFPEITQTLSLQGARIIFAPHAVPRISGHRRQIWHKYIPARGYDNRVFMACCNLWDAEKYGGGILITDPRGNILSESYADKPHLLVTEIDLGNIPTSHYFPAKRRKELYK